MWVVLSAGYDVLEASGGPRFVPSANATGGASILLDNTRFTSAVDAQAAIGTGTGSGTAQAITRTGALLFESELRLQGERLAELVVQDGFIASVAGAAVISADTPVFGGTPGLDRVAGTARVAISGIEGRMQFDRGLRVSAVGIGGFGQTEGGDGTGGIVQVEARDGREISVADSLVLDMRGGGGQASGSIGGSGFGGNAADLPNLVAADGGIITLGGDLVALASGTGAPGTQGDPGGNGTGGRVTLRQDNDGRLSVSGSVLVDVRGLAGGTGFLLGTQQVGLPLSSGGNADGGIGRVIAAGGQMQIGQGLRIDASALGGNRPGGRGTGGVAELLTETGGGISLISGDLTLRADGLGGLGAPTNGAGGLGEGGRAEIRLLEGSLTTPGDAALLLTANGTGAGGIAGGGDGLGGEARMVLNGGTLNGSNAIVLRANGRGGAALDGLLGAAGLGRGGDVVLDVSSVLETSELVASSLVLEAFGLGGGSDGGTGALGQGGNAFLQADAALVSLGSLTVILDGVGGGDIEGGTADIGGTGVGGDATLVARGGGELAVTGTSLLVSTGLGGLGRQRGGDGEGGRLDMAAFSAIDGARLTLGGVQMIATGTGRAGVGGSVGADGGIGGSGRGGNVSLRTFAQNGRLEAGAVEIDVSGQGGAGGRGGDRSDGPAGNGGAGGAGEGGVANFGVASDTVTGTAFEGTAIATSLNMLGRGTGGAGGLGGMSGAAAGGDGGAGGAALGGNLAVEVRGGTVSVPVILGDVTATGGNGGAGGIGDGGLTEAAAGAGGDALSALAGARVVVSPDVNSPGGSAFGDFDAITLLADAYGGDSIGLTGGNGGVARGGTAEVQLAQNGAAQAMTGRLEAGIVDLSALGNGGESEAATSGSGRGGVARIESVAGDMILGDAFMRAFGAGGRTRTGFASGGTGGLAEIVIDGGGFEVTGQALLEAMGRSDRALRTGDVGIGQGGTAQVRFGAGGGTGTFGAALRLQAEGQGGAGGGDAGRGVGGFARVDVGSGTMSVALGIDAEAYGQGGNVEVEGPPAPDALAGTAQGGTAEVLLGSGSLTVQAGLNLLSYGDAGLNPDGAGVAGAGGAARIDAGSGAMQLRGPVLLDASGLGGGTGPAQAARGGLAEIVSASLDFDAAAEVRLLARGIGDASQQGVGGDAAGGIARVRQTGGDALLNDRLELLATAEGGAGPAGSGRAAGGLVALEVLAGVMTVRLDTLVDAGATGAVGAARRDGGDALAGDVRLAVGGQGSATLDAQAGLLVRANATGGDGGNGQSPLADAGRGGDATGGDIDVLVTGAGSLLRAPQMRLESRAVAGIGAPGGFGGLNGRGGDARGGTSRLDVSNGGTVSMTGSTGPLLLDVTAVGGTLFGGEGALPSARAGNATGGEARVVVLGGTLQVPNRGLSLLAEAFGGENSREGGSTGQGGTVELNIGTGAATLGGGLVLSANGFGGGRSDVLNPAGGGLGGQALLFVLNGGALSSVGDNIVSANGNGHDAFQSLTGGGGDGTGGFASVLIGLGGSSVTANGAAGRYNILATGAGGAGPLSGGIGDGGRSVVTVLGSLTLAGALSANEPSLNIDTRGQGGVAAGANGNGGAASGGSSELLIGNGAGAGTVTATAGIVRVRADAEGGSVIGADPTPGEDGGDGGAATGGQARVAIGNGALAGSSLSAFRLLVTANAGRSLEDNLGGRGGTGAVDGDGGDATAGEAALSMARATLTLGEAGTASDALLLDAQAEGGDAGLGVDTLPGARVGNAQGGTARLDMADSLLTVPGNVELRTSAYAGTNNRAAGSTGIAGLAEWRMQGSTANLGRLFINTDAGGGQSFALDDPRGFGQGGQVLLEIFDGAMTTTRQVGLSAEAYGYSVGGLDDGLGGGDARGGDVVLRIGTDGELTVNSSNSLGLDLFAFGSAGFAEIAGDAFGGTVTLDVGGVLNVNRATEIYVEGNGGGGVRGAGSGLAQGGVATVNIGTGDGTGLATLAGLLMFGESAGTDGSDATDPGQAGGAGGEARGATLIVNIGHDGEASRLTTSYLEMNADSFGGGGGAGGSASAGGAGGAALGGTATVRVRGAATASLGVLEQKASAEAGLGGNGNTTSGVGGAGAVGTGGTAELLLQGAAQVTADTILQQALGTGGAGGLAFGTGAGGVAGAGTGGAASVDLSGSASLGAVRLEMLANGQGGIGGLGGGGEVDGDAGTGTGGLALLTMAGTSSLTLSQTTIGALRLEAQGLGGELNPNAGAVDGAEAGDALGGEATVAMTGGTLTVPGSVVLNADAVGGAASLGWGSDAFGGLAVFDVGAGSALLDSALTLAANAFGGETNAVGATAGTVQGGTALLQLGSGSLDVRQLALVGASAEGRFNQGTQTGASATGGRAEMLLYAAGGSAILRNRLVLDAGGYAAGGEIGAGDGIGGDARLEVAAGTLTVLGETRIGAEGGGGTVDSGSADGGDGIGGLAEVVVGNPNFVGVANLQALTIFAGSFGGDAAFANAAGVAGGDGGAALDGNVRLEVGADGEASRLTATTITLDGDGFGGRGGVGGGSAPFGTGGLAVGASTEVVVNETARIDAAALTIEARGAGGTRGAGGAGEGGASTLTVQGGTIQLSGLLTANLGGTGAAGTTGVGGAGLGGSMALEMRGGGQLLVEGTGVSRVDVTGVGGIGGTGFAGGAGQGGLIGDASLAGIVDVAGRLDLLADGRGGAGDTGGASLGGGINLVTSAAAARLTVDGVFNASATASGSTGAAGGGGQATGGSVVLEARAAGSAMQFGDGANLSLFVNGGSSTGGCWRQRAGRQWPAGCRLGHGERGRGRCGHRGGCSWRHRRDGRHRAWWQCRVAGEWCGRQPCAHRRHCRPVRLWAGRQCCGQWRRAWRRRRGRGGELRLW
jgi:hypothetical protein